MATLRERNRAHIAAKNFGFVDRNGEGHLPIHDESHIRNAMARFGQTKFESVTQKESARRKIVRAAKAHGIEVSKDDAVATPARTVRAAAKRNVKKAQHARRTAAR